MGDSIVETQARDILARFTGEVQRVMDLLLAERDTLLVRVRELTDALEVERAARLKEEARVEAYRRDYQKLYVKAYPPTLEDIDFWRNARPSDFTMSWDELKALAIEVEAEQ
jgi:hypothetical protein